MGRSQGGADLLEFLPGPESLGFGRGLGLPGLVGFLRRGGGGLVGGLDFFVGPLVGLVHPLGFPFLGGGQLFLGPELELGHLLAQLVDLPAKALGFGLGLEHLFFGFSGGAAGSLGQVLGGPATALLGGAVGVGSGHLFIGRAEGFGADGFGFFEVGQLDQGGAGAGQGPFEGLDALLELVAQGQGGGIHGRGFRGGSPGGGAFGGAGLAPELNAVLV